MIFNFLPYLAKPKTPSGDRKRPRITVNAAVGASRTLLVCYIWWLMINGKVWTCAHNDLWTYKSSVWESLISTLISGR